MLSIQPNMYLALSNNRSEPKEEIDGIPFGVEVFPDPDVDSVIEQGSDLDTVAEGSVQFKCW